MKVFRFNKNNGYSVFRSSEKLDIENAFQRAYETEVLLSKQYKEKDIRQATYHATKAVKLETIFNELRDL